MPKFCAQVKDCDGKKRSDAYQREKLAASHSWISPVYEQTSDFILASVRHFGVLIARTDEAMLIVYFQLSGSDPQGSDETYFEAVDTFVWATTLAGGEGFAVGGSLVRAFSA